MSNIKAYYLILVLAAGLVGAMLVSVWVEYDYQVIVQQSNNRENSHNQTVVPSPRYEENPLVQNSEPDRPVEENIASPLTQEPAGQGVPQSTLPQNVHHHVPFTVQAPFANWDDRRYQNACEEASLLMAMKWLRGETLTPQEAYDTIADIVAFEQANYGFYIDASTEDTFQLLQDYYEYDEATLRRDVSIESIKTELAAGNIIIVPVDGRRLTNPYFVPPGPARHMLVIIGYDEQSRKFVTNDPGTRQGAGFGYDYEEFMYAIRDYESGDHLPVSGEEKVMIVIKP